MDEYLTEDLWTNIFARLSPKTLACCSMVCRSCRSLIKEPHFVNAHLKYQKSYELLLARPLEKEEGVHSLHFDDQDFTEYTDIVVPLPHAYRKNCRIMGSCDGILCFTYYGKCSSKKAFLWNPAIRKCLRLPQPQISFIDGPYDTFTGFGFDSSSRNYKVVMITDPVRTVFPAEANVYTLSSGTWRQVIISQEIQKFVRLQESQVYLNGAVNWLLFDVNRYRYCVMSFDMCTEACQFFELPGHVSDMNEDARLLTVDESIAFVETDKGSWRIWLLKEDGCCRSWTKKVDVTFDIQVDRLIGVRKNGELLIEIQRCLYSYDLETMGEREKEVGQNLKFTGVKRLGIHNRYSQYCDYLLHSETYSESLVSPGMQTLVEEMELEIEEEESTDSEEYEINGGEEESENGSGGEETGNETTGEETDNEADSRVVAGETGNESMDEKTKNEADSSMGKKVSKRPPFSSPLEASETLETVLVAADDQSGQAPAEMQH